MTSTTQPAASATRRAGIAGRVWGGVVATWGVIAGIAPHVLHHVGPLAGAALLAGFGGKAIFFALGLILSIPMLRRLHRRFRTLVAPAIAVAVFAAMFAFSSLVIAPLITGSPTKLSPPGIEQPADDVNHASHHAG
ncbi:unannotated protein [freshwater metagenome]|uniref:Unannotated protein n=1 Tax=freshwater metagenome TaxID=449393 RepID=A0A6J7EI05_9ZZZZ